SGALGAFSPRDLMTALLVSRDLLDRLESGGAWRVYAEKNQLFLTQDIGSGRERIWRVRRSDGLVEELVQADARGNVELRVKYRSYRLEDGPNGPEPFPDDLTITVGDGLAEVRLE